MAHVKRPDGTVVESKLFKDLLHYTSSNRQLSKEYYAVGTNEEFLSQVRESEDFKTDENGEITFDSLRKLAKMDLESDKLLQILNKDFSEGKYRYSDAKAKVEQFNNNNEFSDKAMATMTYLGNGQYYVSVIPTIKTVINEKGKQVKENNTANEQQKLHDTIRNQELEDRIKALLKAHGVAVKFLEGDREGGRYTTENASRMENGLYGLIELNEKGHVTDILAEEAGHFAVGALGDNPLVQRLQNVLKDSRAQEAALGSEEYKTAQLGDKPSREVAGRLVGKALQRKLDNGHIARVLANRIANIAKRAFYGITGNEVRWAAAKAEQIANKIAYQFADGSNKFKVENAIDIQETMLDKSLTINQQVYRDTIDELGRMCKRLEAISRELPLTGSVQASLAMATLSGIDGQSGKSAMQMIDAQADVFAFDGIVQALVQVTDYLGPDKQIDTLLKSVDLHNPSEFYANMARNGRNLHQARVFLNSAATIIDIISEALDKNHSGGSLILANGSTLEDVRYQDEQGNWKTINIKDALSRYRNCIAADKSRLNNLETSYFAAFCEDIYGGKYITTTLGKTWGNVWKGTEVLGEQRLKIADMVRGEIGGDIDIFHRFLGSMSNNPDIIGQIVDKLVKNANKVADDITLQYRNKLEILLQRAKKMNLDMADLLERDENGVPTGNMITPPASATQHGNQEEDFVHEAYMQELNEVPSVHYGRWENARQKFKEEAWEEFKKQNPDWEGMAGFARGLKWDQFLRPKMKAWNKANSIRVDVLDPQTGDTKYVKWVPNAIYKSDQWENLKKKYPKKADSKDSLKQWINDYRTIKAELDGMLPVGSTSSYRLPQFRGTFTSAAKQEIGIKGKFKGVKDVIGRRWILDNWCETSQDTDYGDLSTMNSPEEELLGNKLNYESERALRLPVFGVNKIEKMQDLSTDLCHSMLAYSTMATSYAALDTVVDALEVGRYVLARRKFKGDTKWYTKAGRLLTRDKGRFNVPQGEDALLYAGVKDNAYGRYIKYLDKQVYGISATHCGVTTRWHKKVLLNKVLNNMASLGGAMFLGGNVMGGMVNTLTGFNNIFKEAITSDYFTPKDWAFAHKYYFTHFISMWSTDWGRLHKQNKLDMLLEHMNATSDNREKFRSWHTTRSRINNFMRTLCYLPYSTGDHYMQSMSYLSVAHGTKLYDTDGNEVTNLWEAFKKIVNTDDEDKFKAGKTLEFNRFCPLNESDITLETLNAKGSYLKAVTKTTANFEDWLVTQDERWADEVYKKDHGTEYNDLREQFNSFTTRELMKYSSTKYKMMKNILGKVESYLNSSSPLRGVPSFTQEEEAYLRTNNLGTGDYNSILQKVRHDIYNIIWSKADESAYMDKCREINIRLHGIYNQQDKTAWHNNWFWNAYLGMKGWLLGYLESMGSPQHHSIALNKGVEGFVSTAVKLPVDIVASVFRGSSRMSITDMLITMICPWAGRSKRSMMKVGYSEEQNFNARRMAASVYMILTLLAIHLATAPPDDEDDEDEADPVTGGIYYASGRAMLEQMMGIWVPETFIQSGQILNILPVGVSAIMDLGYLAYQTAGTFVADEDNAEFFYQRNDPNGRYEEGTAKAWTHFERLVPYYKSWWGLFHPYQNYENYMFGRKMTSR